MSLQKNQSVLSKTSALMVLLFCSATAWAQPSFNATFAPDTIGPGSTTTLIFTVDNSASATPVTDLAFTNTLPTGVTIATPALAVSECINGLVVAPNGGSTITFTNGRVSANTQCTVAINVTSSTVGIATNTSGDLTSSAGNSGTASDDLTVATDRPGFSKSFSPNVVNFGDRSTLTFTIDNSLNPGNQIFLSFIDNLPIGMSIADPSGLVNNCPAGNISASPNGVQFSYFGNAAFLAPGDVCTISVDVQANARGELNNITENFSSSFGGPALISGKAGDVLLVNSTGDIQLTQSFLNDPVVPGDSVELQFNLTSLNRNFDITDIDFTNDLDATLSGLTALGLPLNDVCGSGSQLSGASILTLTGGNLAPEDSCSFSVTLQVPAGTAGGVFPNTTSTPTGQITGQPTDGSPSTDSLFVNFAPSISKTFTPDSIIAGETTTMEFTLTNTSNTDTASDISFDDNLSQFLSGVQVTNLPAAGFCGAGSNIFTSFQVGQSILSVIGGNLAANASCTFAVDLITAANASPGAYLNTTEPVQATVAGQTITGKMASAELIIQDAPELSMSFTDDPVGSGDTVTVEYRISSAGEGSLNATAITFTHDLDATLTGLVATGLPLNNVCGAGSQLTGTGLITLTGGSINNGAPCAFNVALQVPAAAVSGNYPSTTSDLTSTVNAEVITTPAADDDLQISELIFSKSFIDDPVLPGDTVTLRYSIENLSSSAVSGMQFTENFNAVISGLAAVASLPANPCGVGSSLSGTTFLIFNGGNLQANESCTFDVTLSVPAGAASNQYGSTSSSLTATIGGNTAVIEPALDTLVVNNDLLSLNKAYLNDPVAGGDIVSLAFTIINNDANNAATGITFTDDLSASLTGLAAIGLPLNDVCGTGSQISGTTLVTLSGGNLVAGDGCTFTVDVLVPVATAAGTYPNITSDVSGNINGFPVTGTAASDDLFVGSVSFNKSFAAPVDTGGSTTLTFTITNNDSSVLSGFSFSDDLDAVVSGLTAVAPLPVNPCGAGSQITGTSLLSFSGGQLPALGGTCSFDVTVQVPAGLGNTTFTNITTDLSVSGLSVAPPAVADLEVNGLPFIDLSTNALDFGAVEVGSVATSQAVTINNVGTADLTINSITAAVVPFIDTGSGTCSAAPFIISPGNSCSIVFSFSPVVTASANQSIIIASNSADAATPTVQLSGSGLQAELSLSSNPLDFGAVELNTSSAVATVTLLNNGTADLDVTNLTAANGDFSLTANTCGNLPFVLTPTNSCSLSYQFTPSVLGAQSQNITIISDAASSPDTLVLQGQGVEAALTLSVSSLSFPNTTFNTTSTELLQTISNTGLVELRVTTLDNVLAPFSRSGGSCSAVPFSLAVNESCTFGYQFTPPATGNFNQSITLVSNAASSPDGFDLTGTGIEPGLQLSQSTLNFQAVELNTTSAALDIILSNTDDGDLQVIAIDAPAAPFSLATSTCGAVPFVLTASQSCTLSYQFSPSATGLQNQTINVVSNAATSPDSFTLTGEGAVAELTLGTVLISFPDTNINSTSTDLIQTLTNSGVIDLNISGLTTANGPFELTGGSCGNVPVVLVPNEGCTLFYQFTPTASGNFTQNITVESNAGTNPDGFDLVGVGIEIILNASLDTVNFEFTSVDEVQTQTISLSNGGADDVIVNDITAPASPFAVDFSDCGTLPITLASGVSCELTVSYTTENNASSSSFLISSNDPTSPLVITLNGLGLSEPVFVPALDSWGLWLMLLLLLLVANGHYLSMQRKKSD